MDRQLRAEFQDPNLAKLFDIANRDQVDTSEALRVIANVLISMEVYTLRDLRSRMAVFDGWRIDFNKAFDEFKSGLEDSRAERRTLELEQAQLIVNRSKNLTTSQKINVVLDAKKVDWGAWWRDVLKNVTGFLVGGVAMAILLFLLQNAFK